MRIAISGSTGFVGSHLAAALEADGHQLVRLGRPDFSSDTAQLAARLQGCEAVIHLAGEPINRRWSESYKQRLFDSRVLTTRRLVEAMDAHPPALFISTSAIGAFGQEGCHDEDDPPDADDFLGRLSREWEHEASVAASHGIRTLIFRLGLVLGHDGGLIKPLLPPFMAGVGGPVGSGQQAFSWIHVDDLVDVYRLALQNPEMNGVYHLCAPERIDNLGFTRALAQVLRRPALLPVAPGLLRLAYGEGAEVMTSGQCVVSKRLEPAGFHFRYPQLRPALEAVVRAARADCALMRLLSLGARV